MRGISRQQHTSNAESPHTPVVHAIRRDGLRLAVGKTRREQCIAFREFAAQLLRGTGIVAIGAAPQSTAIDLRDDRPMLGVEDHIRLAESMGLEVEAHVRRNEPFGPRDSRILQLKRPPHAAVRAVRAHQPLSPQRTLPIRGLHADRNAVVGLRERCYFVIPADFRARCAEQMAQDDRCQRRLSQVQVVRIRRVLRLQRRHVEVTEQHVIPGPVVIGILEHADRAEVGQQAQCIESLHYRRVIHDRARLIADGGFRFEHHHTDTRAGETQGGEEADRTCTCYDHAVDSFHLLRLATLAPRAPAGGRMRHPAARSKARRCESRTTPHAGSACHSPLDRQSRETSADWRATP